MWDFGGVGQGIQIPGFVCLAMEFHLTGGCFKSRLAILSKGAFFMAKIGFKRAFFWHDPTASLLDFFEGHARRCQALIEKVLHVVPLFHPFGVESFGFGHNMGHRKQLMGQWGQACVIVLLTTTCVSRLISTKAPITQA